MNLLGAGGARESGTGCRSGALGVRPCGCRLCVLGSRLSSTAEWFLHAADAPKRRFLTDLLLRCHSLHMVRNVEQLLQVTLGKDFTYARCRQRPGPPGGPGAWSSERSEGLSREIMETWRWFNRSSKWTKANYLLGVLPLCDASLLHLLGSLTRGLLHLNLNDLEDDAAPIPESHYSFYSDGHPELNLLISSSYGPLEDAWDLHQEMYLAADPETDVLTEAPQAVSEVRGRRGSLDGDGGSPHGRDSAVRVIVSASELLSGVSRYADFIRRLPVHLAKRILAVLDEASLCSCLSVCRHWRYLAEEVQVEFLARRKVVNRAMTMQADSCSRPNPVYARILEVLVPIREEEEHLQAREVVSRSRRGGAFQSVYAGVATSAVPMEERNVYCGAFSLTVLCEQSGDNPLRVAHYCGGDLVATGSRDKAVRLLDTKTAKPALRPLVGHTGSVRVVLLSEQRGLVLSAGYDLSIRCWSLQTGLCMKVYCGHTGTVDCLDLQDDLLLSGARDCKVKVWNLLTGKCYKKLKFQHEEPIRCVKIQKRLVLSGCQQGVLKVWGLETATLLWAIAAHEGPVSCLFCDPWHILSGGVDGLVRAWSASCRFEGSLMTFRHPVEVLTVVLLFLRVITGCSDGRIRIFSFLSGECLRGIRAGSQQVPVRSLHAYPDRIVVNTSAALLLLQFSTVRWDYTAAEKLPGGPDAARSPAVQEDLRTLVGSFRHTRACGGSNATRRAAPPAMSSRQVRGVIFGVQTESPNEARREPRAYWPRWACSHLPLGGPWGSPVGGGLTGDTDAAGSAKKRYRPARRLLSRSERAVLQTVKTFQHAQQSPPGAARKDAKKLCLPAPPAGPECGAELPGPGIRQCLPAPPAGLECGAELPGPGIRQTGTSLLARAWSPKSQRSIYSGTCHPKEGRARSDGLRQVGGFTTGAEPPPWPPRPPQHAWAKQPGLRVGFQLPDGTEPPPLCGSVNWTPSGLFQLPTSTQRGSGCGCEPSGSRKPSGRGGVAHSGGSGKGQGRDPSQM